MSADFSLGFLSRVYSPSADPKVYRDTLELFRVAEELGFDSGWVAQHHFASENGRLPSPLVLLAAIAQRTRRISLGSGIIVLPQEAPLRLAEDAAVLDLLSHGRLELGLGAGFDPETFVAFGRAHEARHRDYEQHLQQQLGLGAGFDPETFVAFGRAHEARHRDYEQHLQQLLNALGNAPLTDSGSRLLPRAHGLSHRLWEATSRVELVAERGHGLIMAPNPHLPAHAGAALVTRYRNAWTGDNGTPARIARVQALFPAPDEATRRDILAYVQRQQSIGVFKGEIDADFDTTLKRLGVLHGPVAQIIEQLQQGPTLSAHDQLILQVQTVSTPLRDALRALEIIREHIAPALGWQPTLATGNLS